MNDADGLEQELDGITLRCAACGQVVSPGSRACPACGEVLRLSDGMIGEYRRPPTALGRVLAVLLLIVIFGGIVGMLWRTFE